MVSRVALAPAYSSAHLTGRRLRSFRVPPTGLGAILMRAGGAQCVQACGELRSRGGRATSRQCGRSVPDELHSRPCKTAVLLRLTSFSHCRAHGLDGGRTLHRLRARGPRACLPRAWRPGRCERLEHAVPLRPPRAGTERQARVVLLLRHRDPPRE